MDIEIPKSTWTSISAIRGGRGFRALRTIPVMLDICKDIERYCPEAIFMNYTNPMAMLCRAMQEVSKVRVTGLCHSVQGTAWVLSGWIGATLEEVNYLCAGVNHQAWYLDFKLNGKDAYPLIREAVTTRPEILNEEQVRNEMFLQLGYYVTESSGHNSSDGSANPELIGSIAPTAQAGTPVITHTYATSISSVRTPGKRRSRKKCKARGPYSRP